MSNSARLSLELRRRSSIRATPPLIRGGAESLDPSVVQRASNGGCIWRAKRRDTERPISTARPFLLEHRLRPLAGISPGRRGRTDAAGRAEIQPGVGWQWWTALPVVCEGAGPRRASGWSGFTTPARRRETLWGPYTIGFLEWDGERWIDQAQPAFIAKEDWEHGSVYEPNLIYHDGKWKMWYVAGSNQEDYLVHGYAESEDGRGGWSKHAVFAPPEMKMFDFCVRQRGASFDAIFARVWVGGGIAPPRLDCGGAEPKLCRARFLAGASRCRS